MAYTKPHFGNLQARAKKLGLIVVRMTTDQDAYHFGGHEYVLVSQHASQRDKDNAVLRSLAGIRRDIEDVEAVRVECCPPAETVELCPVKEKKSPTKAEAALRLMKSAKIARAETVIGAFDREAYAGHIEDIKAIHRNTACRMIADEIKGVIRITEYEKVSAQSWCGNGKDLVSRAEVVVMTRETYESVIERLNEIHKDERN